MTVYWPIVQARLVELLPTLPGYTDVKVTSGRPLTDADADAIVAVGFTTSGQGAGSFEFVEDGIDGMRGERGTVLCEMAARNGDQDQPDAQADVFALYSALDTAIRADERLGVLPVSSTTSLSADVVSAQDTSGATQRLIVSVSYFTRS